MTGHVHIHYKKIEFELYDNVILKAHYHISDKCSIRINNTLDDGVEIILTSDVLSDHELEKMFNYYLSQEKIKAILYNENHRIKELIVEQAFKPINNLKMVL